MKRLLPSLFNRLIFLSVFSFLSFVRLSLPGSFSVFLSFLSIHLLCCLSCPYLSLLYVCCDYNKSNIDLAVRGLGQVEQKKNRLYKPSEGPQRGEETDANDDRFEFFTVRKTQRKIRMYPRPFCRSGQFSGLCGTHTVNIDTAHLL